MHNPKFHSFPFHSFPKEYMLGTTGNFEYFRIGSPILTFTGTTGNDRERAKLWRAIAMTEKSFSGADLFGMVQQTPRTNSKPEAAALVEVLKALRAHPAVSWAERQNTGSARIGGRFVRFGWPGCSDVLGMLHDGRFLAVECKSPTGRLRPEQTVFLERINKAGGVAFVARGCRDVFNALGPL